MSTTLFLFLGAAAAAPSCGCSNLTTCCTLWSGSADPGFHCDAGPLCNAQVCTCPPAPAIELKAPPALQFASAHLYTSSFTVGPEPVVATDCRSDMVGNDANLTLQSEFAGAAGGATWRYSTFVLPLVPGTPLANHTVLLRAKVRTTEPLMLSISAMDTMPADRMLFHEGPKASRPERACPTDGYCLVADPLAATASKPPCGFAPQAERLVTQPVSKYASELAVDVTSLVASGNAVLQLHVAPNVVQPSGAWAADLVMRQFALTVQ